MQLKCPYCKTVQENEDRCGSCHKDIRWAKKLYEKSEAYYAKGYACAQHKDLTRAIKYLEKVIAIDKYHIEARNLLGVVLFEQGRIGEALKYWILSSALYKEDNKADEYIAILQKQGRIFELYKEAIILYNRSIKYLEKGSEDMAIIRLKKAAHLNPNFLEARNLLAACYISQKQYTRAEEQISYVLQVDVYNDKALRYLKAIKLEEIDITQEQPIIHTKDVQKKVHKEQYKPHKVINRGHRLATAILYFAIGGVCMLGVQVALIMPNKTAGLQLEIRNLDEENSKLQDQIKDFKLTTNEQIITLEAELNKQKQSNEELQKTSNKLKQEQKLSRAKDYATQKAWSKAADEIYNILEEELDETKKIEYKTLKDDVYPKAVEVLYNEGYGLYKSNKPAEAKTAFEKAVLYYPSSEKAGRALYFMGEIEEISGNIAKAKQHYEGVVEGYKGQNAYYWAQNKLKNLAE